MKAIALMQIAMALILALPTTSYALLSEPTPFYVYDGVSYTRVFLLPETYYVAIEEEGEEYTRVTYLDLSGYVRSKDIEKVDYEPQTKYATGGKIELNRGVASVFLYSDATLRNVLTPVTVSDEIFLYGKSGYEEVYYCRVKTDSGWMRGYLSHAGVTVTLPPENDTTAVTPTPTDPTDNPTQTDPEMTELALPIEILLAVCLAIPAFLLVLLLTRKKK